MDDENGIEQEEDEVHYTPQYDCPELQLVPSKSLTNELLLVACG